MGASPRQSAGWKGTGEGDVSHYRHSAGESRLRRRAAWVLGVLVVVAGLLVTLMVLFLNSGGNGQPSPKGIKPLPTAPPSAAHGQHSVASTDTSHAPARRTNRPSAGSPGTPSITEPPRVVHRRVSCPGDAPCIANGDIGNAVAAINAYRVQHGVPAVSGAVTRTAQTCAVTNGSQCTGSWAESQVSNASGEAALRKVAPFTDLLDRNLVSLQVGWAYDPAAHEYYFAVISSDS